MTKLEKIRQALADYIRSEGCSCCQDTASHEKAADRLGKLLDVPQYTDGSGYDFRQFSSRKGKSDV